MSDIIHPPSQENTQSLTNAKQWRDALTYMSHRVKKQSFATWLKPTIGSLVKNSDGKESLNISAPNQFVADWLKDNYQALIEEALLETAGKSMEVTFNIRKGASKLNQTEISFTNKHEPRKTNMIQRNPTAYRPSGSGSGRKPDLHPRYSFDNLVVGNFNQFAHAASVAVAENPGGTKYNPLVIYGGTGLGKTHLGQAICQSAIKRYPNIQVIYATSDVFTSDFINSITTSTTAEFARKYRSVDILLIDDIQFFTGKESTQEQFFHVFNALYNSGKQIVLTADRLPQEIRGIEERLQSRFNSGLVTDIQQPDLESRIAILQKRVEEYAMSVGNDVLEFIAANITSNIRELEGALTRLFAKSSLERNRPIDLDFAHEALGAVLGSSRKTITAQDIQRAVSQEFNVPFNMMRARKKSAHIALARQVAMWAVRNRTDFSLQRIGEEFGGRDHSTVIHACNLIGSRMDSDDEFRNRVDRALSSL
ncbi:MAG: chromosomal replication initiator protein DnaA [candidate division Zixibacteria bacterium]|nr:chromosomal replication initiator protein DnaA [candidate division Zixibacteria bacterium]